MQSISTHFRLSANHADNQAPLKPRQHGALQILYCIVLLHVLAKQQEYVMLVMLRWPKF